jgi:hypothetical protein
MVFCMLTGLGSLVSLAQSPEGGTAKIADPLDAQAPPVAMPVDVVLQPDQAILRYLIQKGYFNAFPDNRFYPESRISRAEFVTLLYRAARLNTPFISEFPYFRDVFPDHWAYIPIEGFRMRNMTAGDAKGFFRPADYLTRQEAGVFLSKTLPANWLKLSSQEIEATFTAYNQPENVIPAWARYDLARSVYAGFLLPVHHMSAQHGDLNFHLDLNEPMTRIEAVRMVYRRALLEGEDTLMPEHQVWLPENMTLVLTPTTAIPQLQIAVGQPIYFALVDQVEAPTLNLNMPRGTRVHGEVLEVSADKSQAKVRLDRAYLPSGAFYNLAAEVDLTFKAAEKTQESFIVPGEKFQIKTNAWSPSP